MYGASGPLILVADDDASIVELLETRLRIAGYATVHARDGWEAVHRAIEARPRAMLLDINMPGLDGFQVLETLREGARPLDAATMMLTARHSQTDVTRAVSLGVRDFMSKPFEDRVLLARVARLMTPLRPRAGRASIAI